MKVLLAESLGMCFGVRGALERARGVESPREVSIHGQIVHNPTILDEMSVRGFHVTAERDLQGVPDRRRVLITAHGVSDRERRRLEVAGKELIDTTCPLVRRAHEAAREFERAGYFVIVVGRPDHVEVRGLTGDLGRHAVVQSLDDVECYPGRRLGVICQTTMPPDRAREILAAIHASNPDAEIRFENTICRPTRERQEAVLALLPDIDALIVVGGRNSNNTRELGMLAESRSVPWLHVEGVQDIDPAWFTSHEVIGLTAGTSTAASTVAEVHRALVALESPRCHMATTDFL